jgi:hypothetical protein
VSRGFLGLTVGCARCHDHKYDADPDTDYYSLAGVFLNTPYREYPLAPKSVVDEYTQQDKKIEKKEKLLDEFTRPSRRSWRDAGAAGVEVHGAAWKVTGEPKERSRSRRRREARLRAVRSLDQVPRQAAAFYPYLTKWQEMIKGGGSAGRSEDARRRVPGALLDVMFEKKEIKDENDVIIAKALTGTKKKEPGQAAERLRHQ